MKFLKLMSLALVFGVFLTTGLAYGKADTSELYIDAVMTSDIPALKKLLAPNYIYIGGHGHIMDKDNFIAEIKDKKLIVNRMTISNIRETHLGKTRIITGNGVFYGKSDLPRPQGLMRFTLVTADNNGDEEVVLFQATKVIPTKDCEEGNCKIK